MIWKIEVKDKAGIFDAVGEGVKKDILDLGIRAVTAVRFIQVYLIEGTLAAGDIRKICEELLADTVTQEYRLVDETKPPERSTTTHLIEVAYNPGVMDPAEESVLKAVRDMGINGLTAVRTAKKYLITGSLSEPQLKTIAQKLLYNKLIQHIVTSPASGAHPAAAGGYVFKLVTLDLLGATDRQLKEISVRGQLFLNLAEMRQIRNYFRKLKRNPTDCEVETLAQTWSEHCWHKTFRGKIDYREKIPNSKSQIPRIKNRKIDNLLKQTIMKVTRELHKPWCVSVFQDNSGVITFDDNHNVCFKVETHNHPSALEPFGGANTGIGGVIRDPLGTGLGAKPILNTDVFCFAPPDYPFSRVPQGSLHPKRIMKGVVSGVRDYGNKMGIPTVNGALLFHEGFVGNPLVYCGTVGIMPKDKSFKQTRAGDLIVLVGGKTGRDGIHGATFSSGELTHESETISSGAVQIGNPIQEKKMVDAILQARDKNLYTAITDCGAGGLSSAVGEMGQELGARVDLEDVPLKYAGLSYREIWISESQERMVLAVPPENISQLCDVFSRENVEATVIGQFIATGTLQLYYQGTLVCDLAMDFLHGGLPRTEKKAVFIPQTHRQPPRQSRVNLSKDLLKLLSHYDICSKEWVIRQYDHEVQGGSVIKPLMGVASDGPSDAAVVRPLLSSSKGIVVANGINFRFGFIDPYWMAASCIDEALRQVIAVGGSLRQAALLDNFCWGSPDKPDRLGGLVRAAYGCYATAKAFGVPFISGKDSLYNEYTVGRRSIAIPGTLLISVIAVMEDVGKAVSMYAKQAGDLIYVVGNTACELGGSHYYDLLGAVGTGVPVVNPKEALRTFTALSECTDASLIRAMHDCSDGGIGVSAAEMAFSGGLGMELFLSEVPLAHSTAGNNEVILFSESNSRFVVEVEKKRQREFEGLLSRRKVSFGRVGSLCQKGVFTVYGLNGKPVVAADIQQLRRAWQQPLDW